MGDERDEGNERNEGLMASREGILILEFGSQYTQLIARRLREQGCYAWIRGVGNDRQQQQQNLDLQQKHIKGVILSGSHHSVTGGEHHYIKEAILQLRVPILGICYGMHLLTDFYGGLVAKGKDSEYGRGRVKPAASSQLLKQVTGTRDFQVWMSHADETRRLPEGFHPTAYSEDGYLAAFESDDKPIFALQFHPEVSHTEQGAAILRFFAAEICNCPFNWTQSHIAEEIYSDLTTKLGAHDRAMVALSGGVDSTVATAMAHKVMGKRLFPIFVDNGLLRAGEAEQVVENLASKLNIEVIHIKAAKRFLTNLKGVTDPEKKRHIIGRTFIEIFEEEAQHIGGVKWLVQGTIYPDVIESGAVTGSAAQVIKSHHNVGGLPKTLQLPLLEPLKMLFKDEVRRLGKELGLPTEFLHRHPFPGPGLAVRILGEVNEGFLAKLRKADDIFLTELTQAGYYDKVSQAFCVFIPMRSVGVAGDGRAYGYIISLRAVITDDFMTAHCAQLPHDLLQRMSERILNQVEGITRVVYDYSSKPPATIEWE